MVHTYYAYAHGIFLITASSCAVVGLLKQKNWAHLLGIVIFFVLIFVSVNGYYKVGYYYTIQKNNASQLDNVAYTIKQIIPTEEIILVFLGNGLPCYLIIQNGGHRCGLHGAGGYG